jgi:hypothetical protein
MLLQWLIFLGVGVLSLISVTTGDAFADRNERKLVPAPLIPPAPTDVPEPPPDTVPTDPTQPYKDCIDTVGDFDYCFAVYCPWDQQHVTSKDFIVFEPVEPERLMKQCTLTITPVGNGAFRVRRTCIYCGKPWWAS